MTWRPSSASRYGRGPTGHKPLSGSPLSVILSGAKDPPRDASCAAYPAYWGSFGAAPQDDGEGPKTRGVSSARRRPPCGKPTWPVHAAAYPRVSMTYGISRAHPPLPCIVAGALWGMFAKITVSLSPDRRFTAYVSGEQVEIVGQIDGHAARFGSARWNGAALSDSTIRFARRRRREAHHRDPSGHGRLAPIAQRKIAGPPLPVASFASRIRARTRSTKLSTAGPLTVSSAHSL